MFKLSKKELAFLRLFRDRKTVQSGGLSAERLHVANRLSQFGILRRSERSFTLAVDLEPLLDTGEFYGPDLRTDEEKKRDAKRAAKVVESPPTADAAERQAVEHSG